MALPVRKRLSHEVPQWVEKGSFLFITINCRQRGRNQICRKGIGNAILDSAMSYHEKQIWHCRLWLLMPDHLHAVIALSPGSGLKTVMANWKKFTARKYGVGWQRDFFDHRLRDHREEVEKTAYVLMNPVRKGLCRKPHEWPWIYRPKDYETVAGSEEKGPQLAAD